MSKLAIIKLLEILKEAELIFSVKIGLLVYYFSPWIKGLEVE